MEFLEALENSAVPQLILGSTYAYYGLLVVHALGMAAVVGGAIMLSLRVLGYGRGIAVSALELLTRIAAWGFVANATSGLLLYTTNASKLTVLWTFQIKIISILLGGLSLWLMWRVVGPHKDEPDFNYGQRAKLAALVTILLWSSAIVSGRYIAYTLPTF